MRHAASGSTIVLMLSVVLLAGCVPRADDDAAWRMTRLYLGTATADGVVDPVALDGFLDGVVSTAFPAGFTRYEALGQWRAADGRSVHERTVVIEIVHRAGDAAAQRVPEVAAAYRARFRQESVLITEAVLTRARF